MDFFTVILSVLGLGSFLGAVLVLLASVILLRAMKRKAAVMIMIGAILVIVALLCSVVLSFLLGNATIDVSLYGSLILVTRSMGAMGWMLVGLGAVMLAPVIAGMARRNRELEEIVASGR